MSNSEDGITTITTPWAFYQASITTSLLLKNSVTVFVFQDETMAKEKEEAAR